MTEKAKIHFILQNMSYGDQNNTELGKCKKKIIIIINNK
jgi:hypothetical protein